MYTRTDQVQQRLTKLYIQFLFHFIRLISTVIESGYFQGLLHPWSLQMSGHPSKSMISVLVQHHEHTECQF